MSYIKQKIIIRKAIAQFKIALLTTTKDKRYNIIKAISYNKNLLKKIIYSGIDTTQVIVDNSEQLPTLGKLRLVIEKNLKNEKQQFENNLNQSDVVLKRLALKEAFFEYYNEIEESPDVVIVDYESDMTLRRDNQEVDKTDFDFAPNKNKIYNIWMEKLNRHARDGRLGIEELDEAVERGIPQGGAFEKQLDRYRKEIMQELWQDYYNQRKDQWKIQ